MAKTRTLFTHATPSINRREFVAGMGATALGATLAGGSFSAYAASNQSLEHVTAPRYLGDMNAPVQIAEYFSMTCGHCGRFHRATFPAIKENLIETGQVRFEMRAFPLDGLALRAHALARIVPVESYYPLIDRMLNQQSDWTRADDPLAVLMKYARLAGVSESEFNETMRNRPLLEAIVEQRQQGAEDWQVNSTPTFVVNNDKVLSGNMSYETFVAELSPFGV